MPKHRKPTYVHPSRRRSALSAWTPPSADESYHSAPGSSAGGGIDYGSGIQSHVDETSQSSSKGSVGWVDPFADLPDDGCPFTELTFRAMY
ncbi:hypothetical protein OROHE_023076 [Orobanche hederae]